MKTYCDSGSLTAPRCLAALGLRPLQEGLRGDLAEALYTLYQTLDYPHMGPLSSLSIDSRLLKLRTLTRPQPRPKQRRLQLNITVTFAGGLDYMLLFPR